MNGLWDKVHQGNRWNWLIFTFPDTDPTRITTQRATKGKYCQIWATCRYLIRRTCPMFLRYCLPQGSWIIHLRVIQEDRLKSAVWLLTRYERCPNLIFGIDWNKYFSAKCKVDSHPGNTPLLACQSTFGVLSPWESALHVAEKSLFQSIPEWRSVNNAACAAYCLISCGKSPIWMLVSRNFDASSHGARTVTGRAFRTTTQDWKADLAIYSPP